MVAGVSSESVTHDPQISIARRQGEGGSELIRLPDSKRRTTIAREQYQAGTAGNHRSLTGSKGQAVGCQIGTVLSMGCSKYCGGPDRNYDQKEQYRNRDDLGRLVSSFGSRQRYKNTFSGHVRPQRYQLASVQVTPSYLKTNS